MSTTINLVEQLLARARRFREVGQPFQAFDLLKRLPLLPDVPAQVAAAVRGQMGELLLRRRRYRQARRHLVEALRLDPGSARYHFLLGLAWQHDPEGDPDRAARHYGRSLRAHPRQPRCLGEAGLLDIQRGNTDRGLIRLRRAVELAPTNAMVVGRLVRGLIRAGLPDEATQAAHEALFQAPRCPKIRQVWIDLQLLRLRRQQERSAEQLGDDAPILLPFVKAFGEKVAEARPMREDGPAGLPGPHRCLKMRRSRRRAP
jgi:Flp pilus assembly protein TadD